jgi:hypothetical protein
VKQNYRPLAESLRDQAGIYVSFARRSNSLRDIVRLIAMASALEHAARKLGSATDADLSDIAQKLNAGARLAAEYSLLLTETQSTGVTPPTEPANLVTSPKRDANRMTTGADIKSMWKMLAMFPRPGGKS